MMSDRTITKRCPHPGCTEYRFAPYRTIRERQEIYARQHWCTRHANPDQVVGLDRPVETVFVAEDGRVQRSWRKEGSDRPGALGLLSLAQGFSAYAADVPAGARLVVTARIELPDACTESGNES